MKFYEVTNIMVMVGYITSSFTMKDCASQRSTPWDVHNLRHCCACNAPQGHNSNWGGHFTSPHISLKLKNDVLFCLTQLWLLKFQNVRAILECFLFKQCFLCLLKILSCEKSLMLRCEWCEYSCSTWNWSG